MQVPLANVNQGGRYAGKSCRVMVTDKIANHVNKNH